MFNTLVSVKREHKQMYFKQSIIFVALVYDTTVRLSPVEKSESMIASLIKLSYATH